MNDRKVPYDRGDHVPTEIIVKLKQPLESTAVELPPGVALRPVFTLLRPAELRALVERAALEDPAYERVDFTLYQRARIPHGMDPQKLLESIQTQPDVELAYFTPTYSEPFDPYENPLFHHQKYFHSAPVGVGAVDVWDLPGALGHSIQVADVERGWLTTHPDLDLVNHCLVCGEVRAESCEHGTRVLGVLCAENNELYGVGAAPHIRRVLLASWHGEVSADNPDGTLPLAEVILKASKCMDYGDIMLLEVQTNEELGTEYPQGLPVEITDLDYQAIRTVTGAGITVIEAAGNGFHNLDDFPTLNPISPQFRDSLAVIVTGAQPVTNGPTNANSGERVDCFAWGGQVWTCSLSQPYYTTSFSGSSAASAIVAGVAIIVQGMVKWMGNGPLSPEKMRKTLSLPQHGTASDVNSPEKIGVMPDLKKIRAWLNI